MDFQSAKLRTNQSNSSPQIRFIAARTTHFNYCIPSWLPGNRVMSMWPAQAFRVISKILNFQSIIFLESTSQGESNEPTHKTLGFLDLQRYIYRVIWITQFYFIFDTTYYYFMIILGPFALSIFILNLMQSKDLRSKNLKVLKSKIIMYKVFVRLYLYHLQTCKQ